MLSKFQKQQYEFLLKIWELAGKKTWEWVRISSAAAELGFDENLADSLYSRMYEQGWVEGTLGATVCVKPYGHEVLEQYMEKTYAEEERIVVETAIPLSKGTDQRYIFWRQLEAELPKLSHDLRDIINELEARGLFLHEIDEGVRVGPKGYEFVEDQSNRSGSITINNDHSQHNTTQFTLATTAFNTIGNYNQITNSQKVNPEFDNAIKELIDLVNASSMANEDREDVFDILKSVNKIAVREPNPTLWERGATFVTSLKPIFETVNLLGPALPHIGVLLSHFQYVG